MSYQKADDILPGELVEQIQQYVDGATLYIPRKSENRRPWGCDTSFKAELSARNQKILQDWQSGVRVAELAQRYHLSEKHIQRVLRRLKG
ncbi:MAG: hypothetical protein IJ347_07900 [Faecalibacterium sp.]|nr:hypothetical protein [Faecalibacterium sp.]